MQLTAGQLNLATLDRQSLLHRTPADAVGAVRSAVAIQAQSPASPYIGLWNRVAGFDPADLDAAFTSGAIVRGNPIRMTLHAVAADEYRPFREATEPSLYAAKLGGRIAESGMPAAEAAAHAAAILDFTAEVRTARECETWLAERLGPATAKAVWPGIRQYAPLLRIPRGGPWSFTEKVDYTRRARPPRARRPGRRRASAPGPRAPLPLRIRTGLRPRRGPVRDGPARQGETGRHKPSATASANTRDRTAKPSTTCPKPPSPNPAPTPPPA